MPRLPSALLTQVVESGILVNDLALASRRPYVGDWFEVPAFEPVSPLVQNVQTCANHGYCNTSAIRGSESESINTGLAFIPVGSDW